MGWHSFLTLKPWCFLFCCFHKAMSNLAWAVQKSTCLSPLPDHLRGVFSSAPTVRPDQFGQIQSSGVSPEGGNLGAGGALLVLS